MDEINLHDMTFLNKVVYLRSEGRKEMGIGVSGSFVWFESLEGHEFWDKVYNGDLTEFNRMFKPEDYTHIDLVCSLPPEILQEMVKEQKRQGNRADLMVFAKDITACALEGGFDWTYTEKGHEYWYKIFKKSREKPDPSSSASKTPERVYIHIRGKSKTFKPFITISKIKSL